MFKKLIINSKKVYPTFVVSTMSSGKSTLINALIGREILSNKNGACTSKPLGILDNDMCNGFVAHIINKNEKYEKLTDITKEIVLKYNKTNEIDELILEGQIKGVKNSRKSLFIIDTPGINNSLDLSHEQITKNIFNQYDEGLVIYVINALQLGTNDDNYFLNYVSNKVKNNNNFKIIFVVNKMDLVDPEKEEPKSLIENCKQYIESRGIKNPIILSVSARGSLIFKKILNGDKLSEMEEEDFLHFYKQFKNDSYSLNVFSSGADLGDLNNEIFIDQNKYTRGQIYLALQNTGITYLENLIDQILVNSSKVRTPKVRYFKEKRRKR